VGLVLWGQDRRPTPAYRAPDPGDGDPGPVRRPKVKTPGEGIGPKVWDFIKKNFI
jgi:hypothetical protein